MNEYVDIEIAASIAGIEEDYISENLQDWVRERIDLMFGRDFQQGTISEENPEIHSIKDNITNTLILKNFPVIEITRLRNDIRSSSAAVLESGNYYIENESGIIKLVQSSGVSDQIIYFTRGQSNVDVAYVYGFEEVPEGIKALANWIAAKLAKYNQLEGAIDPGTITEVTIGDYKEKKFYDDKFRHISSKYDKEIESMRASLNKWRNL